MSNNIITAGPLRPGVNTPTIELVLGADIASAATISVVTAMHRVSGVATITTINPPYVGFTGELTLIATGAWALATGGNIAAAVPATAGQLVRLVYDGTTWYPAGGVPVDYWYSVVQLGSNQTSWITDGGAFGVGAAYAFPRPVTVQGIRFYWIGGFGALSVKCSMWDDSNTRVAFTTVSVNAAGIYTATFSVPQSVSAAQVMKRFVFSAWETTNTHCTQINNALTTLSLNDNTAKWVLNANINGSDEIFQVGPNIILLADNGFISGDVIPSSFGFATAYHFPVEPIFTCP